MKYFSALGLTFVVTYQSAFAENIDLVKPVVKSPEQIKSQSDLCNKPAFDPPIINYMNILGKRLQNNWEPDTTSKTQPRVKFRVESNGSFHDLTLINPSPNAQANFSCIQAVAETDKFLKKAPGSLVMETDLSSKGKHAFYNCISEYRQKHRLPEDVVVWHVIPLDALQANEEIAPELIHNQSNLRVIKKGFENSDTFNRIRADWLAFLRSGKRTAGELKAHRLSIEKRYANIMEEVN